MAVYFASDSSIAIGVVRDKTKKTQYGMIIIIIIIIIILSLSLLHQMLITARREQKVSLLHSSVQL